mmetsp:Transcript_20676/g.20013  ORF Transcript_20676/g.20013 Transcript_20676/m.20013 type:complete len:146 (-) Transcript_20676:786-1223(-)
MAQFACRMNRLFCQQGLKLKFGIQHRSMLLSFRNHDRHHYSDSAKEKKWNEEQGVFKNTPCEEEMFLHIAPCGDYWLGQEIYAAKHLPSGYVRSIKLPDNFDENDDLLNSLPEDKFVAMYDTGALDSLLISAVDISNDSNSNKPA